jgi:hypothetical protein
MDLKGGPDERGHAAIEPIRRSPGKSVGVGLAVRHTQANVLKSHSAGCELHQKQEGACDGPQAL